MTLYFERHDGQAVTCDDFAQAIADANPDTELARPAAAVQALVQPGRHAARSRAQARYDAAARSLHAELRRRAARPRRASRPRSRSSSRSTSACSAPTAASCRCSSKARPTARRHPHAGADAKPSETLHLRRRRRRAGALDPARLHRAGDPGVRLHATPSCCTCWPTTPTRSTAGKPASAWRCAPPCAGITRAGRRPREQPLDEAFVDAMRSVLRRPHARRRLQGTGADAAVRDLHRRAARRGRSAARPRRARGHARAARRRACAPTGSRPTSSNHDTGAYSPDPLSAGRRALAGLALAYLCLAAPAPRRHASGRARRCSASRTRAT